LLKTPLGLIEQSSRPALRCPLLRYRPRRNDRPALHVSGAQRSSPNIEPCLREIPQRIRNVKRILLDPGPYSGDLLGKTFGVPLVHAELDIHAGNTVQPLNYGIDYIGDIIQEPLQHPA